MKIKRMLLLATIVALLYPAWGCENDRPKGDLVCCCPAQVCIWLPAWFVNSMDDMDPSDSLGDTAQTAGELMFNLADYCQGPVGVEDPPLLKCCLSVISDSPGMSEMVAGASRSSLGLCYYQKPDYDLELSGSGDGDHGFVPVDSDNDLICDQCDNCATVANAELMPIFNDDMPYDLSYIGDGDGPRITLVEHPDTDNDMAGDACDNCLLTHNPDQADSDGNGIGDACEETVCPPIPETPPSDGSGGGASGDLPEVPPVTIGALSGSGCSLGELTASSYGMGSLLWVFSLLGFSWIRLRSRE